MAGRSYLEDAPDASHPDNNYWSRTDTLRDGRKLLWAIQDVPENGVRMHAFSIAPHDQRAAPFNFDCKVITDPTGMYVWRVGFVGGENGNIMMVCDGGGCVSEINTFDKSDGEECKLDFNFIQGTFDTVKPDGFELFVDSDQVGIVDPAGSWRLGLKSIETRPLLIASSDSWVSPEWVVDLSPIPIRTLLAFSPQSWGRPERAQQMVNVMESLISERIAPTT